MYGSDPNLCLFRTSLLAYTTDNLCLTDEIFDGQKARVRMIYKPNFCCNCGEPIQRIDWNLLTSRRFCEVCALENRKFDLLPRTVVLLGALSTMFAFGTFFGSDRSTQDPTRSRAVRSADVQHPSSSLTEPTTASQPRQIPADENTILTPTVPLVERQSTEVSSPSIKGPSTASEVVYYCGARTKKGTPCSRRVKNRGERCWQHKENPMSFKEN